MWREAKDVRADDLPAIVVLVQLIRLVVRQVVASKVVTKHTQLQEYTIQTITHTSDSAKACS